MIELLTIKELFDLSHTLAAPLLQEKTYPWEAIGGISEFVMRLGPTLSSEEYDHPEEGIWIAKSAKVAKTALLCPPCIIGKNAEIRHCAFLRGSILVGEGAVVGNSTELKNVILFDCVEVPHYNYVGDSVLGYKAHMGAGAVTSNIKSDKTNIVIKNGDEQIATGLRKFGAALGDHVEVGCNSVLNPGTVVGPRTSIYPLSRVRGMVPADSIFKGPGDVAARI